jgi:nitrogen fixation/metabolism regulation signal transduction histidine kinase
MSTRRPRNADDAAIDTAAPLTLPQLAHELNNLLDGSLRSLRLAERALEDAAADEVQRRLRITHRSMEDIRALLGRAMRLPRSSAAMLASSRTAAEEASAVGEALEPMAERAGVALDIAVEPAAGGLPAGPVGAILTNGIRNAIEACARGDAAPRRVAVRLALDDADDLLVVEIRDTGPGLPGDGPVPVHGHGEGLGVCRRIVADLGGRIALENAPGGGAVLRAAIPAGRLAAP